MEVSSNVYDALDDIKRRYYDYYQGDNDSNMKHIQSLNDSVASIKHHCGNVWLDEGLLEHEKKDPEQIGLSNVDYQNIMKQKVMATAMIKRANRTRYADVIANMRREYSCGLNTYPTTIEQAHNILNKHEALFKLKERKSGSTFRGRFNNDNDATFFGSLLSLWPGESITDFKLETSLQKSSYCFLLLHIYFTTISHTVTSPSSS